MPADPQVARGRTQRPSSRLTRVDLPPPDVADQGDLQLWWAVKETPWMTWSARAES